MTKDGVGNISSISILASHFFEHCGTLGSGKTQESYDCLFNSKQDCSD